MAEWGRGPGVGQCMAPNWSYWDQTHLMAVYHGTYPSCLPGIFRDGRARSFGAGCTSLKEVHGVPAPGVDTTHRAPAVPSSHPQTWGAGWATWAEGRAALGASLSPGTVICRSVW